jgi:hypothetical protein
MISCKTSFIVILWAPRCCSPLFRLFVSVIRGVVILQLFVLLKVPTTYFMWASYSLLFLLYLHLLFLWLSCNSCHFDLAKHKIRFKI